MKKRTVIIGGDADAKKAKDKHIRKNIRSRKLLARRIKPASGSAESGGKNCAVSKVAAYLSCGGARRTSASYNWAEV